jgi:hypothetical protein
MHFTDVKPPLMQDRAMAPPPEARPQAIARAKERYDRLMKTAGQSVSNGAHVAMQDLTGHGTN